MAGEDQVATIGAKSQFWFEDETGALYRALGVKSFSQPTEKRERVETTELDPPGMRHTYVSGLYEDSEIEVVLNHRPLSDTDIKLREAVTSGTERNIKLVLAENGVLKTDVTFPGKITGYEPGDVEVDSAVEATVTVSVEGPITIAAHA